MRKVVFGLLVAGSVVFTACDNAASKIEGVEETNSDAPASANDIVNDVNAASGTATFQFEEERHDFGDIAEGTVAKHTFKFTNTGDAPLIIYNAQGSCGCTVPEWPREAIAPGATGEIKVSFNSAGRPGVNNKQVTLTANTVPNKRIINITSNVIAKAATSEVNAEVK
jgi:hypothetical protein